MMTLPRPALATTKVWGLLVLSGLVLAACSSNRATVTGSLPTGRPGIGIYKVGKPYQVNGVWYYPSDDPDYDEKGIASWYGPNFHEKYTANGEIFDQNELTAAHKTLPMPSVVEVTNLENGRSIRVRVNDRGPFVGDRIIDLSRRAAQLLGFERDGTAKVEVRYDLPDSLQAQALARENGAEPGETGETPKAAPASTVVAEALPSTGPAPAAPPAGTQVSSLPPPPAMPSYAQIPAAPAPPLPQTVTYQPVGPSHIYIQAGAFAVGENATRMKERLDGLGPVSVVGVQVNGMNVYRVRLGPIATVDEADRLLGRVRQAGATEAKIIVN